MSWTFDATKAGYANMWRSIQIKSSDLVATNKFANLIVAHETQYRAVTEKTGVPWYFIGALHMRESGCDFAGVLHNGEKIIGKGTKTTLVPAGRGPFSSWEEAAVDALKLKDLDKITDWSIERMGFHAELFNGLGYVGKGVNSPYLWAGSNHEQTGKYVADHVWDRDFDDPQIGVMTVIKRLTELRPDIAASISETKQETKVPEPTSQPAPAVNEELLRLIVTIITAIGASRQPQSTPPTDPAAPAPAKDTTGFGAGILGLLGYVAANAFGFVGSPTGAGATAAGQIIPAVAAGIGALGFTGKIGAALKIVSAIVGGISAMKKTGAEK